MRKNIMISQPMSGRDTTEIYVERQKIIDKLDAEGYTVLNSFFDQREIDGVKNQPVYYLAKAIEVMSKCDVVYFCKGWENSRGCAIEHRIAKKYGLEILEEK